MNLDGTGRADIATGIAFLDHMLSAFSRHARFDLTLRCQGDLEVDDHHTVEDCAIGLGAALDAALGDRAGIRRFGHAFAPLDEALVRAVVDLSGRPYAVVDLPVARPVIGGLATENARHFFESLAVHVRAAVHLDLLRGRNAHHCIEAAFKAAGLAIAEAVQRRGEGVPSTKGVL